MKHKFLPPSNLKNMFGIESVLKYRVWTTVDQFLFIYNHSKPLPHIASYVTHLVVSSTLKKYSSPVDIHTKLTTCTYNNIWSSPLFSLPPSPPSPPSSLPSHSYTPSLTLPGWDYIMRIQWTVLLTSPSLPPSPRSHIYTLVESMWSIFERQGASSLTLLLPPLISGV